MAIRGIGVCTKFVFQFDDMRSGRLYKMCALSVGGKVSRAVVHAVIVPDGFPELNPVINLFASRRDSNVPHHADTFAIPRIEFDAVIDTDSVNVWVRNHFLNPSVSQKESPLVFAFKVTDIAHSAIRFAFSSSSDFIKSNQEVCCLVDDDDGAI